MTQNVARRRAPFINVARINDPPATRFRFLKCLIKRPFVLRKVIFPIPFNGKGLVGTKKETRKRTSQSYISYVCLGSAHKCGFHQYDTTHKFTCQEKVCRKLAAVYGKRLTLWERCYHGQPPDGVIRRATAIVSTEVCFARNIYPRPLLRLQMSLL